MRPVAAYSLFGLVTALAVCLFLFAPSLDLAVSGWFYDPQHGFVWAGWGPVWLIEHGVPWITRAIIAVVAIGAITLAVRGRPLWRFDRKALLFVALATALGPGLVVNTLLKDHWGRARPAQVTEFGGAHHFTPAPLIADQCDRNCAFVSGHAALGFSLVAFAFLLPAGRRRRLAIAAALGFGALVGAARIAGGRHFLSDVAFAGLIVVALSGVLYEWIVRRDLFAGPTALRFYRGLGRRLTLPTIESDRFSMIQTTRLAGWIAIIGIIEAVSLTWLDRPIALFFHEHGAPLRAVLDPIQRFGLGTPYLIVFALAYVFLRCSPRFPGFRQTRPSLSSLAWIPGFLLAAVGVSGLIADLLKVVFGRARPKLLFANDLYDFTWMGWQADHWSFPSGHAATAAALATALWCLWPRPLVLYAVAAFLIALSRVVSGAHYPSDVVMGAFIGIVLTRAIAAAFANPRFAILLRPQSSHAIALPRS